MLLIQFCGFWNTCSFKHSKDRNIIIRAIMLWFIRCTITLTVIPWGPLATLLIWALFLATNKLVGEQNEDLEYMLNKKKTWWNFSGSKEDDLKTSSKYFHYVLLIYLPNGAIKKLTDSVVLKKMNFKCRLNVSNWSLK